MKRNKSVASFFVRPIFPLLGKYRVLIFLFKLMIGEERVNGMENGLEEKEHGELEGHPKEGQNGFNLESSNVDIIDIWDPIDSDRVDDKLKKALKNLPEIQKREKSMFSPSIYMLAWAYSDEIEFCVKNEGLRITGFNVCNCTNSENIAVEIQNTVQFCRCWFKIFKIVLDQGNVPYAKVVVLSLNNMISDLQHPYLIDMDFFQENQKYICIFCDRALVIMEDCLTDMAEYMADKGYDCVIDAEALFYEKSNNDDGKAFPVD